MEDKRNHDKKQKEMQTIYTKGISAEGKHLGNRAGHDLTGETANNWTGHRTRDYQNKTGRHEKPTLRPRLTKNREQREETQTRLRKQINTKGTTNSQRRHRNESKVQKEPNKKETRNTNKLNKGTKLYKTNLNRLPHARKDSWN